MMSSPVRTYETMVIANPNLGEEGLQQLQGRLAELLLHHGGKVLEKEVLGKRKLSYPIASLTEGVYLQIRFEMAADQILKLQKGASLIESIVRMVVLHPSKPAGPVRLKEAGSGEPVSQETAGSQ